MNKLQLKRVSYGKESTPKELREYYIIGQIFPVGTIAEWESFAKSNGFNGVVINE